MTAVAADAVLPAQVPNYYAISTLAGNSTSGDGETANSVLLSTPLGTATDKDGNIFFIDQRNGGIRRISTTNIISTVAIVVGAIDLAFDRSAGSIAMECACKKRAQGVCLRRKLQRPPCCRDRRCNDHRRHT